MKVTKKQMTRVKNTHYQKKGKFITTHQAQKYVIRLLAGM